MLQNLRYSSAIVHPLINPQAFQSGDEVIDAGVQVDDIGEVEEELEHPVEVGETGTTLQKVVELQQDVHLSECQWRNMSHN